MKFFATKNNNSLEYKNPQLILDFINSLKDGQEVILEIKVKRKIRTLPQNALYWCWLDIISQDTGFTSEELHDTFKAMFLTDNTRQIPIVRSTTVLDTEQFTKYLNKIEDICFQKLNIKLPLPEELYT